jgi:hypothetical protein
MLAAMLVAMLVALTPFARFSLSLTPRSITPGVDPSAVPALLAAAGAL